LEKWVKRGENEGKFRKKTTLQKNWSHLKNWVISGKRGHTRKNGSHLEKWVNCGKKRVKLGKEDHTWKNRSHLKKMGHT